MKRITLILLLVLLFNAAPVWSQCFVTSFGTLGSLSNSTGNDALDTKFRITKTELEDLFKVSALLYIYEDGNHPNAYAKPSDVYRYDGIVAFGRTMLKERLWNQNKGEAAVAGILAHEYAHVMQLKKDLHTSNSQKRELQADFLAGYFMGHSNYGQASVRAFGDDLASLGDYEFGSSDHHGTPEERLNAMLEGYGHRYDSANDAYNAGLDYVNGYHSKPKTGGGLGQGNDGDNSGNSPGNRVFVACTHLMHPAGDLIACSHVLHPAGDLYPCTHACQGPYGIVACHPAGDVGSCNHRVHPNDIAACQHLMHPQGHWQ